MELLSTATSRELQPISVQHILSALCRLQGRVANEKLKPSLTLELDWFWETGCSCCEMGSPRFVFLFQNQCLWDVICASFLLYLKMFVCERYAHFLITKIFKGCPEHQFSGGLWRGILGLSSKSGSSCC